MNFIVRFDEIVDYIEENCREKRASGILERLAKKFGMSSYLLNAGFQFIADMSIIEYARQRSVINALAFWLDNEYSLDKVADIYGFSAQSALSNACKKLFDVSPTNLTPEILKSRPKLSIQKIIGQSASLSELPESLHGFGVTTAQFKRIHDAIKINEKFHLSTDDLEYAFEVSEKYHADVGDTIRLVHENIRLSNNHQLYASGGYWYTFEETEMLSLKYGLGRDQISTVIYRLRENNIRDATALSDDFYEIFLKDTSASPRFVLEVLKDLYANDIPLSLYDDIEEEAEEISEDTYWDFPDMEDWESELLFFREAMHSMGLLKNPESYSSVLDDDDDDVFEMCKFDPASEYKMAMKMEEDLWFEQRDEERESW